MRHSGSFQIPEEFWTNMLWGIFGLFFSFLRFTLLVLGALGLIEWVGNNWWRFV